MDSEEHLRLKLKQHWVQKGRNQMDQQKSPRMVHQNTLNFLINLGAQFVCHVANKTNDVAGDGTTAAILHGAIFNEGCTAVAAGLNPMRVKHGIDKEVNHVTLKDAITNVATISSNGDKISRGHGLIGDAFEKIENDGVISIQDGKSFEDTREVVEGIEWIYNTYCNRYKKTGLAQYDNPLLLFVEKTISSGNCL